MKLITLWKIQKKNMKLPKKDLNRYHSALQECIRYRKEWITYYKIKLRWQNLRGRVNFNLFWNNPIIGFVTLLINIPTIMLKLFQFFKIKSDLKEIEMEIKVLQDEMIYIDHIRWNTKEEKNLKILK